MRGRPSRFRWLPVVALSFALVTSACMAPAGPGGSAGSESTSPSAASATIPSPSPSPDVAGRLVVKLKAMSRMSMMITAQLDIGGTAATVSGRFDASGEDKYSTLTTKVGDAQRTVEETTWAGTAYTRNERQPWYPKPAKAGGMTVDRLTSAIQSAKDIGTTTFQGQEVHRLRPSGPPVDPAAIGFDGKGSVDLEILAAIDGTPVRMSFTIDLTQGATHLTGTMDMTFLRGAKPIIKAPDPVFTTSVSKQGFSFGRPVTWEPWSENGWEAFDSPNGGLPAPHRPEGQRDPVELRRRSRRRHQEGLEGHRGVEHRDDLAASPARTIVYRFKSDGADAFGIDVDGHPREAVDLPDWTTWSDPNRSIRRPSSG